VNGIVAPLLYASPTQINFQMPSSVSPPVAEVVVNNQTTIPGRVRMASNTYRVDIRRVHPGIFVSADRASALNSDLSVHTPATPIGAGEAVIIYITGQGSATPPVEDGTAAPSVPLSIIDGSVRMSIGGREAQVIFQGLAPGLAGMGQINAIVPSGLMPGDQPVFVTINGIASNAGLITVK
jgi:adhesin/invasin